MYIDTYIHTYLHTYIPTYLHTYIHTYIHTYLPTYIHTYLHTYIPTYLHTYIHTYLIMIMFINYFNTYMWWLVVQRCVLVDDRIGMGSKHQKRSWHRFLRPPIWCFFVLWKLWKTCFFKVVQVRSNVNSLFLTIAGLCSSDCCIVFWV